MKKHTTRKRKSAQTRGGNNKPQSLMNSLMHAKNVDQLIRMRTFNKSEIDPTTMQSPLQILIELQWENMARTLIDTKMSVPDHVRLNGNTALMDACQAEMSALALKLIKTGNSLPDHVNLGGETALIMACANEQTDVALALIQTGKSAPGQIETHRGVTALIYACALDMPTVALELLKTDACRPHHIDTDGESAATLAEKNKMADVLEKIRAFPEPQIDLQKEGTDYVMHETSTASAFLASGEYPDPIVVSLNGALFFTSKHAFTVGIPDNIRYACAQLGTLRPENIDRNMQLFALKSTGIMADFAAMSSVKAMLAGKHQTYALEPIKRVVSVVSDGVLRGETMVSAAHCQDGQGGIVYWLTPIRASTASGGGQKSERGDNRRLLSTHNEYRRHRR